MKALITVRFKPGTKIGPETLVLWAKTGYRDDHLQWLLGKERHKAVKAAAQADVEAAQAALKDARSTVASADIAFVNAVIARDDAIAEVRKHIVERDAPTLAGIIETSEVRTRIDKLMSDLNSVDGGQAGREHGRASTARRVATQVLEGVQAALATAQKALEDLHPSSVDTETATAWLHANCLVPITSFRHYLIEGETLVLKDKNGKELVYRPRGFPVPKWWRECQLKEAIDCIDVVISWSAIEAYELGEISLPSTHGRFPGLQAVLEYEGGQHPRYKLRAQMNTKDWASINRLAVAIRARQLEFKNSWSKA